MARNLQTTWTERELLATDPLEEPLIVAGYRCHGGFDSNGRYHSPRTHGRVPAIEAWQAQFREQCHTDLLDIPLETWPRTFPNVAQAKHLLRSGVNEPIVSTLTRIGTVEGFGAMIRHAAVPDRQCFFVESIEGTAIEHLDRGLFEAHARDEAGWEDESGHKEMWFAARDLAFESPPTEDETERMLERMGIPTGASATDPEAIRQRMWAAKVIDDLDLGFEMLLQRMINILLIEISAFHTFAWAEEVLSDQELVAGEGEAATVVSYIRADETPHVEYLKTTLSEVRERTLITESGRRRPGREVIEELWDRQLATSLGPNRAQLRENTLAEVERACAARANGDDIFAEFTTLGDPEPAVAATKEPT
ncbi:MAG TPA: hypothetical protein VIC35_10940 [Acidimicrobiia bacterium]